MTNSQLLRLRALQTAGLGVDEIAIKLNLTNTEVALKLTELGYRPQYDFTGREVNKVSRVDRYYRSLIKNKNK